MPYDHRDWRVQINDILAAAESVQQDVIAEVKATVEVYHALQGVSGLWSIIGMQHYSIGGEDCYVVACSRPEIVQRADGSAEYQCLMHSDLVIRRGAAFEIMQPLRENEDTSQEGRP